jgi:NAD-dependent DNA ligase (contains BRCT domain type II)
VGWVTAQTLARHFGNVDALANASQEELVEAEGIGPERAEAIAEWFRDDDNLKLVAELRELGLRFESGEEDRPVEGPLTGQQYVITGTLERYSREQARDALEALGAKVSDNVSKKTAGSSSATTRARKSRKRRKPACRCSPRPTSTRCSPADARPSSPNEGDNSAPTLSRIRATVRVVVRVPGVRRQTRVKNPRWLSARTGAWHFWCQAPFRA